MAVKKDTKQAKKATPAKRGRPAKPKDAGALAVDLEPDKIADAIEGEPIFDGADGDGEDMSEAALKARERLAKLQILEGRVVQLQLQNKEKIIALDAKCGALTYITTALSCFGDGMRSFMNELRNMPDHLQAVCNLTPEQYRGAQGIVEEMLQRLGRVDFHLDSSESIDRKASELQAKTKEAATQRKSARIGAEEAMQ